MAFGLHTSAVDPQEQCPGPGTVWDVDGQGLLAAEKCAEVRHLQIQPGKIAQTCHHLGRLPKRQPEQHHKRHAGLDCGIGEDRLTPTLTDRCSRPLRLRIEPDHQRPTNH